MWAYRKHLVVGCIAAAPAAALGLGWLLAFPALVFAGGAGFGCLLLYWIMSRLRPNRRPPPTPPPQPKPALRRAPAADPSDVDSLVERMLAQGRYALLLRPQIARNLSDEQFARALAALQEGMALVPEGEVVLGQIDQTAEEGRLEDEEVSACSGRVVEVEHFFLDRYPVTNRQFLEFVSGGGYEQISLWDEKIFPAVLDFVDETGQPGPRFWRNGCYPPGLEDHPVVGVCWHEAAAFARWVGKRLATDAEWVKAGAWPVTLSEGTRVQRKYPWGDTMDRSRAHLWGSGPETTVPVYATPGGVSVGGVYQLIGNVWEWTRGDFASIDPARRDMVLDMPMKSIRGGAFDTYFDNQATCQFQSGEAAIARKRNLGFRCALSACDVMLARAPSAIAPLAGAESERASLEEVPV